MMDRRFRPLLLPLMLVLILSGGCATLPYQYGAAREGAEVVEAAQAEGQIDRGRPVPWLDGIGHYVISLPTKLLLFNWRVDNHRISPETEKLLGDYLAANHLPGVKVRLNQYAPGGEWRRLVANREMPGFFKYTFGVFSTTLYTILPGRFFGGDNYNPYTNTISIYSDQPAVVLHEGAHAKDFAARGRGVRGWYAFMRILPLVPLWQEARATGDAVGYTIEAKLPEERKDSYQVLYPAYATYIAGEGLRWVPLEPWLAYAAELAVTVPGHVAGRVKAALAEEEEGGAAAGK